MRTLIRNVKVYDGLGSFPFISDILIEKERISKIALKIEEKADKEIDGTGLCLSPGFINTHSHSDLEVFRKMCIRDSYISGLILYIIRKNLRKTIDSYTYDNFINTAGFEITLCFCKNTAHLFAV